MVSCILRIPTHQSLPGGLRNASEKRDGLLGKGKGDSKPLYLLYYAYMRHYV